MRQYLYEKTVYCLIYLYNLETGFLFDVAGLALTEKFGTASYVRLIYLDV